MCLTPILRLLAALTIVALWTTAAAAERRVALVVGNAAYQHAPALRNTTQDARDIARTLRDVGFTVLEAIDSDKRSLERSLQDFAQAIASAEVALFYYAGHAVQVSGRNYIVPIDADLKRERDIDFQTTGLQFVLRQMELEREGRTSIVILDACRDNPLARNLARSMGTRSTRIGQGLAGVSSGVGTFVAYATQPDNVALDGDGANSPFTASLKRHIRTPGRSLSAIMIEVRKDVIKATDGRQVPWDLSALTGEFYFIPAAVVSPQPAPPATGPRVSSETVREIVDAEERLRRLEKGVASLPAVPKSTPSPAPAIPPVAGDMRDRFRTRVNDRLEGNVIATFDEQSLNGCQKRCQRRSGCLGYQMQRVGTRCELFDRVDRRVTDRDWISGVRTTLGPRDAKGQRRDETSGNCVIVRRPLQSDVSLSAGQRFCNAELTQRAEVLRVTSSGVSFRVNDKDEFTCGPGNVCQFDWPGAPYFSVAIAGDEGKGLPASASMVPARR